MSSNALARLLAAAAAKRAQQAIDNPPAIAFQRSNLSEAISASLYRDEERGITYNEAQSKFISLLRQGNSCVLVGAAGTGKTTCMKGALNALIQSGLVPVYEKDGHKHLDHAMHGILICAFTRRAVANIKKNLSDDLKPSCCTVHAALEYAPEYYDVLDPVTGDYKTSMRFVPTRNSVHQISNSIKYVVIEESSMLGTDLFAQLKDALRPDCKFILLGDIQQLPPVFGSAILGFKMLEYPVVELTEVYRQALESPIISLAHRILSGTEMSLAEMTDWNEKHSAKGLSFHPIKKRLHPEHITPRIAAFLKKEIADGNFNTETDVCLIPFNKGLGTLEMNREIADYLGKRRNAIVHEVIAGFICHYFAAGDKVLYEKEDAEIISINRNSLYMGMKTPKPASETLDRWGYDSSRNKSKLEGELDEDDFSLENADAILAGVTEENLKERKNEASHCITVRMLADGSEITLSKTAEINQLLFAYCLTTHKSQGSEFRKVYCIFHQSHNTMLNREHLYTAVTRAREELYIICESDTFERGIRKQAVPGNSIQEKALHFKGKVERGDY